MYFNTPLISKGTSAATHIFGLVKLGVGSTARHEVRFQPHSNDADVTLQRQKAERVEEWKKWRRAWKAKVVGQP